MGNQALEYKGLLLNAPYKIDSMVWMRLMIYFLFDSCCCFLIFQGGYMNPGVFWGERP
jgi:hypothetical protein